MEYIVYYGVPLCGWNIEWIILYMNKNVSYMSENFSTFFLKVL